MQTQYHIACLGADMVSTARSNLRSSNCPQHREQSDKGSETSEQALVWTRPVLDSSSLVHSGLHCYPGFRLSQSKTVLVVFQPLRLSAHGADVFGGAPSIVNCPSTPPDGPADIDASLLHVAVWTLKRGLYVPGGGLGGV
jgi:hypothetical protein